MADKQQPPPRSDPETAPDPDEDDLDDLDDVLDQFNATSLAAKPQPAQSASHAAQHKQQPDRPPLAPGLGPNAADSGSSGDAELDAQLQAGIANLLGEMDDNPAMQQQFEAMMQELLAAGQAGSDEEALRHIAKATEATPHTPSAPSTPKPEAAGGSNPKSDSGTVKTADASAAGSKKQKKPSGEESFQDTIRRTMERMQASGDSATSAAQSGNSNSEDEMIAQLMKELMSSGGAGELGEGSGGGEEDFSKLLLNMMTQLTNKEILYEPMKELHDKFPAWMRNNQGKVGGDDMARYREQQGLVREIVARFERKGYTDDNEEDREYIVERMQKMQAAGSPPPDLVGDMSAAQAALGDIDAGCPPQ